MSRAHPDTGAVSVLLGVGSNLGDRESSIEQAVTLLRETDGIEVAAVSRLIETDPAGGPPQGRFLNGAIEVLTLLAPAVLLAALHRIEAALGRSRGGSAVRWGPRTIDIDLLLYGDRIIREPDLEIPHPRMLERAFVLEPLAEIAPLRTHPVTGLTVLDHLKSLRAHPPIAEDKP